MQRGVHIMNPPGPHRVKVTCCDTGDCDVLWKHRVYPTPYIYVQPSYVHTLPDTSILLWHRHHEMAPICGLVDGCDHILGKEVVELLFDVICPADEQWSGCGD